MSNLEWKRPDDFIRLQRLKQKQKALQARIKRPAPNATSTKVEPLVLSQKRKNPFAKSDCNDIKKPKYNLSEREWNSEDSLFELLNTEVRPSISLELPIDHQKGNVLQKQLIADESEYCDDACEKPCPFLPIDWSLKTKLRILSATQISGNNLKTSQEVSGLTSFVRCIDLEKSSTGLDISPGALFFQSTLYWQHPNLPWLTLYPRNSKDNANFQLGDGERAVLAKDWINSFRSLFQLVRSRQCPYFYMAGNTFTVLFRAAGIGGRVETHAILTPTSRGMRAALKQEEIEFTMPLKNKSNESPEKPASINHSFSNSSDDTIPLTKEDDEDSDDDDDDDDLEDEKWLESLGVEANEIKKIRLTHAKKLHEKECETDFSDQSTVLIEGVECQAFFNFLLNAKSTTTNIGRLAGIPPTLLAPVSFLGATLKNLQIRSSKVRMDDVDYFSTELQGVVLPHVLPYLNGFLSNIKDKFSATMVNQQNTLAFSKISQKLINDVDKENNQKTSDYVFGRENLSDSGMNPTVLEAMCRVSKEAVRILDRVSFNKECGYSFN